VLVLKKELAIVAALYSILRFLVMNPLQNVHIRVLVRVSVVIMLRKLDMIAMGMMLSAPLALFLPADIAYVETCSSLIYLVFDKIFQIVESSVVKLSSRVDINVKGFAMIKNV
jgi:hypothetical protein